MFVMRNESGVIVGAFANLQPGVAEEYLQENDGELAEFFNNLSRSGVKA